MFLCLYSRGVTCRVFDAIPKLQVKKTNVWRVKREAILGQNHGNVAGSCDGCDSERLMSFMKCLRHEMSWTSENRWKQQLLAADGRSFKNISALEATSENRPKIDLKSLHNLHHGFPMVQGGTAMMATTWIQAWLAERIKKCKMTMEIYGNDSNKWLLLLTRRCLAFFQGWASKLWGSKVDPWPLKNCYGNRSFIRFVLKWNNNLFFGLAYVPSERNLVGFPHLKTPQAKTILKGHLFYVHICYPIYPSSLLNSIPLVACSHIIHATTMHGSNCYWLLLAAHASSCETTDLCFARLQGVGEQWHAARIPSTTWHLLPSETREY